MIPIVFFPDVNSPSGDKTEAAAEQKHYAFPVGAAATAYVAEDVELPPAPAPSNAR